MKIFVTGIGVITAIGRNVAENLNSLQSLRTGLSKSSEYNLVIGEVPLTNEQLTEGFHQYHQDHSRTSLLALPAVREAWGGNRHSISIRTGLISSTSVGGMDRTERFYFEDRKNNSNSNYHLMVHDNGRTTELLAKELGISGYISTISTACSSGANAIMQGARLMEANRLDRVIAGGSEPLAIFDIKGFSSLNIYDPGICKPFDENRNGLNLGEGAAFLVLESEKSLSTTGNQPICVLSGWNNATDAFHQTASSPEGTGAYLAMIHALEKAGLSAGEIDYVNAHGTGTPNNDLSESVALKKVFARMPPFSSTKGFTGHTLAAAGAIEAVYCTLSLSQQSTLPNINFVKPMDETGLQPETAFRPATTQHILSNSFGFGGNCTSLIFSKA
ncbi:MAG: beta-ketoacyl-[acyl-carrier-protein] synthase family protein [Flavisolibacter sp.]